MFSFVKHLSPIPLIQNTWNQKCFKFWILSILENSQTHSDLRGEVRSLSIYVSHRPYTYSLHAGPLSGSVSVSALRPWRLLHVRSDGDFPSWRLADAQTTWGWSLFDFRLRSSWTSLGQLLDQNQQSCCDSLASKRATSACRCRESPVNPQKKRELDTQVTVGFRHWTSGRSADWEIADNSSLKDQRTQLFVV